MADLFSRISEDSVYTEHLGSGIALLHGFALACASGLSAEIAQIAQTSPLRQLTTPGGFEMSVSTTACGALGWHSDQYGYRYVERDPLTGHPWPAMPESFQTLARTAATEAGFADFNPDSCLINRYLSGTKMSLHQDRNERDFSAPIVSVSLGLPATFVFGGDQRSDPVSRLELVHGDVLVWGGAARLRFHGVLPLPPGVHETWGAERINLTFRLAG